MEVMMKELGEIITGNTPSKKTEAFWSSEDICFIKPDIIADDGINEIVDSNEYISENARKKVRVVGKNSIFITCIGSIGKIGIASDGEYAFNQQINAIIPNDRVQPKYLAYNLLFNKPRLVAVANAPVVPIINKSQFGEFTVNIETDIDRQYEIVDVLDKLTQIIQQRNKEISALDDLIKARFVEMFGDIKTNEYGWEKCTFKDVSKKITDGEHGTVPRVDEGEGYLYFMARNITKEGEIDLSETSFVPREIHEKIYKRCNPEKDDLLLVCVGATIGKCTLVSEIMGEFSMARSVALIKPNKEMVTSNFLINLLRSEAIQNDIEHCSHAAAQAGLYTNMINSLEAFVPPMDLQIEFDTFCEQVNKSKVKVQKALDETQKLFDSLMQQYFG